VPELRELFLAEIDPPPLPARMAMDETKLAELSESMASTGLLQPISVVARISYLDANQNSYATPQPAIITEESIRYEIIAGHRRFMAANRLGWAKIRCVVFQPGEINTRAAMLAENIHREDLSAAEEAVWFAQLLETDAPGEQELCKLVHRSPDYVADRLRLLRGDPEVFQAVRERTIKFSVARELNKCKSDDFRRVYLDSAIRGGTNARMVAQWVANSNATPAPSPPNGADASPPQTTAAPAPFLPSCIFCGATHDPSNLEVVYLHRWERRELEQVMQAMKDGLCRVEAG
jgi:ParB/RepB/Spo0J family partition protein